MKVVKIILKIFGVIIVGIGMIGFLSANAGDCPYGTSESTFLPRRLTQIDKINPESTKLDFGCVRLSTINGESIKTIEIITKFNLPFGGVTDEGVPDYSKPWSLKAVINGQLIEAEGSFPRTFLGWYLDNSHWILFFGVVLFIASFFIKKKSKENKKELSNQKP